MVRLNQSLTPLEMFFCSLFSNQEIYVDIFKDIIIPVIGGLGIFFLGLEFMEKGIQNLSVNRMRELLARVAGTPVKGLFVAGISAIFFCFSKREKKKNIDLALMDFSLIFYGLSLLTGGLKPLKDLPEVLSLLSSLKADSFGSVERAEWLIVRIAAEHRSVERYLPVGERERSAGLA